MEEEELEPPDWAPVWLQYWLVASLPLTCTARLWDTLLAVEHPSSLIACESVAVLEGVQGDLMELDYPEMKGFLQVCTKTGRRLFTQ